MPEKTTQQEFPYSREDRFRILREALGRLPESLSIERPGDRTVTVRRGRELMLSRLMETLIVFSSGGECRRSLSDLAELCRFSLSTVRRMMEVAEALGWIDVDRPRGGRANVIRIDFATIKSWRSERSKCPQGTVAPELVSPRDTSYCPVGTDLVSPGDSSTICIPFLPPPPPRAEPVAEASVDWAAAAAALKDCGVGDRRPAIEAARNRGCAAAEVLALCDHFRRHRGAWQPQFLRWRVMTHEPGDDPRNGWPEKSAEYRKAERRRREDEKRKAESGKRDAGRRQPADDGEDERALAALRALDDGELERLIARAEPFERDWMYRQRGDPRELPLGRTILKRVLATETR